MTGEFFDGKGVLIDAKWPNSGRSGQIVVTTRPGGKLRIEMLANVGEVGGHELVTDLIELLHATGSVDGAEFADELAQRYARSGPAEAQPERRRTNG